MPTKSDESPDLNAKSLYYVDMFLEQYAVLSDMLGGIDSDQKIRDLYGEDVTPEEVVSIKLDARNALAVRTMQVQGYTAAELHSGTVRGQILKVHTLIGTVGA